MQRLSRILRTTAAALPSLLCAAAVVLWVRSYLYSEWVGAGGWRAEGSSIASRFVSVDWAKGSVFLAYQHRRLDFTTSHAEAVAWIEDNYPDGADFTLHWKTHEPNDTLPSPNRLGFAWDHWHRRWDDPENPQTSGGTIAAVPFWLVTALLAIPTARRARTWAVARRRRRSALCPTCGYDLRATPDRCPECGTAPCDGVGTIVR